MILHKCQESLAFLLDINSTFINIISLKLEATFLLEMKQIHAHSLLPDTIKS